MKEIETKLAEEIKNQNNPKAVSVLLKLFEVINIGKNDIESNNKKFGVRLDSLQSDFLLNKEIEVFNTNIRVLILESSFL